MLSQSEKQRTGSATDAITRAARQVGYVRTLALLALHTVARRALLCVCSQVGSSRWGMSTLHAL